MDPMEDPDDILRAHRSREKSYLFDVAFDFTATQVRGAQAQGHTRSSLCPLTPSGGSPWGTLPPTLSLPSITCCLPTRASVRVPAWCIQSLLCGHAPVSTQRPPYTGTHTAHPTGGPYGSWRRVLEAHLVLGGELREADTLPGTPVLPICGMLPAADVMRASSGLGAGSRLWGEASQVS